MEKNGALSPLQTGFRRGRSCADQVLLLKETLLHRKRQGLDTLVALLDVRKAYDSLPFAAILQSLRRAPAGLGYSLAAVVLNQRARVKLGQDMSEEYPICTGVPQGGPEAPLLFNLVFNEVFQLASSVRIPHTSIALPSLGYADDLALIGAPTELQAMLTQVETILTGLGLQLNPSKCMIISFCHGRASIPVRLRDGTVLQCST